MRIESSTVENHRFGVSRRRGYDPAEVDAVMSRVADTLAQYERMIRRMSQPAPDDIKSVVEAQESKNQLIADAKHAAAAIVDAATEEARAIRDEATITADRIIGAADDHLAAAQMDAQRIREEADSLIDLAASRAEELRIQADHILTSAIAEAESVREQAESAALEQSAEAEKMLHFAQAEANRLSAEAVSDAGAARNEADAQVADILAQTRQQAEAMINSAMAETRIVRERTEAELDELRESRQRQADEILARARNQAAEIKAAAAAAAEAIAAQGRADAEEAMAAARAQALDRLAQAQLEAEAALDQAAREAETTMAAAREDTRRLERRVVSLRDAVADFEAHIANLAEVAGERTGLISDMIAQELRQTEAEDKASGAPPVGPKKRGKSSQPTVTGPIPAYAEPDGSGQLPASRPVSGHSNPWSGRPGTYRLPTSAEVEPEGFIYDGGSEEYDFESPIEEGVETEEGATSTIYQRRGGGIKRRVAAIRPQKKDA